MPVGDVMIYALLDEAGRVRYVGKAVDAEKRLKSHLRDMRRRNTPLYSWLRKHAREGFIPTVQILETCESTIWPERERSWISYFRSVGDLLNVAAGGDEPYCPVEVRRENARKVAKIRRTNTPEAQELLMIKRLLSLALARGECSEEQKAQILYGIRVRPEVFGCLAKYFPSSSLDSESRFQVI